MRVYQIYHVVRHDFSGTDVIVASSKTAEKAENLRDEYEQLFIDKGFKQEEFYFYVTTSTFYNQ